MSQRNKTKTKNKIKDADLILVKGVKMFREGVIACDIISRDIEFLHAVKNDLREMTMT